MQFRQDWKVIKTSRGALRQLRFGSIFGKKCGHQKERQRPGH
ncbi:hypothetical protein [Lysobacter gummosus]